MKAGRFETSRRPNAYFTSHLQPEAPYRREHALATSVERMMQAEMGVNWKEYADALLALDK